MANSKYEILRVPPNENSFKHAYEYIKAYLGDSLKVTAHEFYLQVESCYFICTKSEYLGLAYIINKNIVGLANCQVRKVYYLDVVLFKDTEDTYLQCYDLIRTITKDKNDKPILIENVPLSTSNPSIEKLKNALRNLKFKQLKSDGESTTWIRYIDNETPPQNPTAYCFFKGRFRKVDPTQDVDMVDKMVNFHDFNNESIAQDRYIKELQKKNMETATSVRIRPQTEEEFMRQMPFCDCYVFCHSDKSFDINNCDIDSISTWAEK